MTQDPTIISGYDMAILTPNIVEFGRLYEKVVSTVTLLLSAGTVPNGTSP